MTGIIDVEPGQPNGALERCRFSGERHDSDAARAYRQGAWLVLAGVLRRIKAFVREADKPLDATATSSRATWRNGSSTNSWCSTGV